MRIAGAAFMVLLLVAPGGLEPAWARRHGPHAVRARPTAPPGGPAALSPLQERRRVQALLRLHLLELREEGLERVRAVIERRLPVDSLFEPPPGQPSDFREH
jgi:hypothetical protein